ncbi:hypothetical protein NKH77_22815 [Streptomyces sp. M19]
MGRYLCAISLRLSPDLPGVRGALIAAAYRTSYKRVTEARGVPAANRPYANRVAHYLKEYTPPDLPTP